MKVVHILVTIGALSLDFRFKKTNEATPVRMTYENYQYDFTYLDNLEAALLAICEMQDSKFSPTMVE